MHVHAEALKVLLAHVPHMEIQKLDLAENRQWELQLETFVPRIAALTSSLKSLDLSSNKVQPCAREQSQSRGP
eukprot:5295057-Amphidinium_carterae.1